jgi:hypothetical protein
MNSLAHFEDGDAQLLLTLVEALMVKRAIGSVVGRQTVFDIVL